MIDPELEFNSTISANSINLCMVDGCLQITFTTPDGDISWGEALTKAETAEVLVFLTRGLLYGI